MSDNNNKSESNEERSIAPLDNSAHFTIGTSNGYVQIEQSHGGQVYYTPEEARDIAADIYEAADNA